MQKQLFQYLDAVWNAKSGGSKEHVLHANVYAPMGTGTFGVSAQLKSIVKHRILGSGKRVSCAKKRADRS